MDGDVPLELADVLYDPQTAGGLLIAVGEERGEELVRRLEDRGVPGRIIGAARGKGEAAVRVRRRG